MIVPIVIYSSNHVFFYSQPPIHHCRRNWKAQKHGGAFYTNVLMLFSLEDNWFDTKEALLALDQETFESLKIPKRLIQLI